MQSWYAVYTKPKQEAVAEQNLVRQDFETYLPRIKEVRRRRGKWADVIAPLFPRYLFVRLDLGKDNVSPIRSTLGVSGLVRFGNELVAVPDPLIDGLLRTRDEQSGLQRLMPPSLEKGDIVTILEGPFEGLQGIFHAATGRERVTILLNILGEAQRVTLSRDLVVRANLN